jgi:hypothetical protein
MARPPHRERTRRPRLPLAFPAALAIVFATIGIGQATPAFALNGAEQTFVDNINGLRTSLGLRPLTVDPQLTAIAHQHDLDMAAAGRLYHSPNLAAGVTSPWRQLAENIGMRQQYGPDLWQAFLRSPSHYANIVNPAFTHIGVGDDLINGTEWTTQRFMQIGATSSPAPAARAPSTPQTAAQVVVPSTARPTTTTRKATTTTAAPAPSDLTGSGDAGTASGDPDPPPPPPQADKDHVAAVVSVLQVVRS